MSALEQRVAGDIGQHALFRSGQKLLVAVSGGVDSMVLLHLLHFLALPNKWRLHVAHLDHRLRGRHSSADRRFVERVARRLGIPFISEAVDVAKLAERDKVSLEMAARTARHEFFARVAVRLRIPVVVLAHHADDQVELFFLRLLRGSSGEGLSGTRWMAPSPADSKVTLVRPLLGVPRASLAEYAAEKRIRFRHDQSNDSLDFQRNRIRHELLPALLKFQPALKQVVARAMTILGAEADLTAGLARHWLGARLEPCSRPPDSKSLPGLSLSILEGPFAHLPVAVQRRVIQQQLIRLGLTPDFGLIERLRLDPGIAVSCPLPANSFKSGETTAVLQPTLLVRDEAGLITLKANSGEQFEQASLELNLSQSPATVEFESCRIEWRIRPGRSPKRPEFKPGREFFDADLIGSKVVLRHWQAGDRFQPIGMGNSVKLQDLFVNTSVPRERRRRLVVAVNAAGEIFWVENQRISERFKLTNQTSKVLEWAWTRDQFL